MKRIIVLMAILASVSIPAAISQNNKCDAITGRVSETLSKGGGVSLHFVSTTTAGNRLIQEMAGNIKIKGKKFVMHSSVMDMGYDGKTAWSYIKGSDEVNLTEPTEEELRETAETEKDLPLPAMPEKAKAVQMQGSPFYQRYMQVQDKYPEHIVLFSRGDFYEALGKGAQILAENLALTLTSRDCGLLERVPMVGVPHYAVDNYIGKALECGLKIVLADSSNNVKVYPQRTAVPESAKAEETPARDDPPAGDGKHWLDEKTYVDDDGLVHNAEEETDCEDDEPAFDMSAYDTEALAVLDELFGNEIILR